MPVRTSPVIVALATICLLVLAPLSISAATYAPAYGMCAQSGDYEPNGVAFTSTGPTACGNQCYALDPANVYAAWDYSNMRCTCATNSPLASQVEANGTAVVPEQIDTCGPNYEVLVTHTTWQFKECSNEYQWTSTGVYNSQADFAGIFALCKNYPLMAIWPSDKYYWACGNGQLSGDTPTTCDFRINRIYSHPADATASGLARRLLTERLHLAEQQASYTAYCPAGKQACALANDPSSYECLDTGSELESCGGCMWGLYTGNGNMTLPTSKAIDCSAIYGAAQGSATCEQGRCRFKCARGFKQVGEDCVADRR